MCFIIPSSLASIMILRYWPDTNGLALEEIARLFGTKKSFSVAPLGLKMP